MPLPAASRIGPYEIVSPLGAGGMGEVYRARDTKLNRDVAIKVLVPAVANDPDRLARFGREAQVLASLNHPNIAAIYGLEEIPSDVVSGFSRTTALVMELVEGEELSAHIARGPMPLADVLPIARQIADALEAAHELGIIHRDLKPANIKVRSDGTVKVLDFGLAKALDPARASNDNVANSPTLTAQGTQAGMILGTAAYMAPEQAKGRAVDRRADIWAFGAVVYEMLTGRRAFDGDDVSEILASVLKTDPNWASVPAETPASVRRLLRRCLERDPRKRLSSIGDARLELEELPEDRTESSDQPAPHERAGARWPLTAIVTAALVTLALGVPATLMVANSWKVAPQASLTRLSMLPPAGVPLFADSGNVSISPDGEWIAFITGNVTFANSLAGQLYVRRISAVSATEVDGAAGAILPFWSPDSKQVAFFADGKLKRVGVEGGRVEEICAAKDGRGGAWNADGMIVFAPANAGGLMRVPANGGTPEAVTSLDTSRGETAHRFPTLLQDGQHFLFAALPARAGNFDILAGSLDGSTRELVMAAESAPVFVSPNGSAEGYLLFSRQNGIVAQRFDSAQRKLIGEPMSFGDEAGSIADQFIGGRAVAASNNGTLAYLDTPPAQTRLHWFNPEGRDIGTVSIPPGHYIQLAVSEDGRSAVLTRRTSPTDGALWIADLQRGGASRLADGAGLNQFVVWSPTGDRVAFAGSRDGPFDIFIKSVDGGAPEERVVKSSALFKFPQSWSPDGKYVVYYDLNPVTNTDLWIVPVTGDDRTARPYLRSPSAEQAGVISPDGKWMAFVGDETGRLETYVTSFPTPGRKFRVSMTGTARVYWRKDGKQLLMVSDQLSDILVSDVLAGAEFSATVPRVVGHLPKGIIDANVTADFDRVLALVTEGGNVNRSITIVQNWMKGLP